MANIKLTEVDRRKVIPKTGTFVINDSENIKQIPVNKIFDVIEGNNLFTGIQIVTNTGCVETLATNFITLEANTAYQFCSNIKDFIRYGFFDENKHCTQMLNTSGDGLITIPASEEVRKFAIMDYQTWQFVSQIEYIISGHDRTAYVNDDVKLKPELYNQDTVDYSWEVIHEETLTEAKNITISDIDCTEVEAYIICPDGADGNFYLTSEDSGTIYGTPRIRATGKSTSFIMKLKITVIASYLWEGRMSVTAYGVGDSYAADEVTHTNIYSGETLNKSKITSLTLIHEGGTIPIGTTVLIRSRNIMPASEFIMTANGDVAYLTSPKELENNPLTATAQHDIRVGTTAITSNGIVTGEKNFPSYETYEGKVVIMPGMDTKIYIAKKGAYDYTQLQAIICLFNTNPNDSVNADKVAIGDSVYQTGSTTKVSDVIKEHETEEINLGITNTGDNPLVVRYFTYKEVN